MDPLDAVLAVWSSLDEREQRNTRHLVEPLAALLVPSEEVEVLANVVLHVDKGIPGVLALTDRRLLFLGVVGLLGRSIQTLDIPYSSISGLNVRKFGVYLLEVASGAGDFEFSTGSRDGPVQLASLIRQCMDEYNRPAPQQVAPLDPVDQLRRLAELRDAGVVSDTEFEAQKQKLLSQI